MAMQILSIVVQRGVAGADGPRQQLFPGNAFGNARRQARQAGASSR
jgi:hypothetical protein